LTVIARSDARITLRRWQVERKLQTVKSRDAHKVFISGSWRCRIARVTATRPTVLVATWREGLFALADQAFHEEWIGQSVIGLTRDDSGNALAIVGGKSLCRRTTSGVWHTIAKSEVELACCVAVGANIYVGAAAAAQVLRVCDDGGVERLAGFDHVPGRDRWYAGTARVDGRLIGPPLGIRSMTATCDGKALFANVHVGGIPRSIDGGITWQPTIEVDSDVHQVCAHPTRPEIVAAATGIGLAMSRDGGPRGPRSARDSMRRTARQSHSPAMTSSCQRPLITSRHRVRSTADR